jgi:Ca2+-transporting ATPase
MQVFNSINARKLKRNESVFDGLFNNYYYIIVQLFIIIGQVILVTFGGRAVRTKRLSLYQHFICILIASLTLVVGFVTKKIMWNVDEDVDNKFIEMKIKEKNE